MLSQCPTAKKRGWSQDLCSPTWGMKTVSFSRDWSAWKGNSNELPSPMIMTFTWENWHARDQPRYQHASEAKQDDDDEGRGYDYVQALPKLWDISVSAFWCWVFPLGYMVWPSFADAHWSKELALALQCISTSVVLKIFSFIRQTTIGASLLTLSHMKTQPT